MLISAFFTGDHLGNYSGGFSGTSETTVAVALGDVLRLSTVNTPKQKRVEEREREMKLGDCSRAKTGLPPDPSKAQSG